MNWNKSLPKMLALLLAAMALAGCADDGDDGDAGDGMDGDGMDGDGMDGDGMDGDGADDEPAQDIVISGTAQGLLDCTLDELAGQSLTSSSQSVSDDAWNGTYTVTAGSMTSAPPPAGQFCIVWSDGSAGGLTGTVPDGATGFDIYVDLGYAVAYEMTITPA